MGLEETWYTQLANGGIKVTRPIGLGADGAELSPAACIAMAFTEMGCESGQGMVN